MNLFYKNFSARIAAAILCAQIFAGCSKEQGAEEVSGSDARLSVSVLGVADVEETSSIDGKTTSSVKSAVNPTAAPKIQQFDGFDVLTSVERDRENQKRISIGSGGKGISGSVMAAALPQGVKYRLMLYRSDGTFVSSTTMTSGTAGNLMVRKGFTYNWYAISYNKTDSVPAISPTNPTLVLPINTDVLYAKGSINIPANAPDGTTPLGIVFNHRLARIAIELNSMGLFARMSGANHSFSGTVAKTGTLDLRSGALSNLTSYTTTLAFNFLDNNQDRAVANLYTADPTANSNLVVSLTGLDIVLDDGSTRRFSNLTATPATFPFTITPVLGQSYRAVMNLIESPITLDGVRWARNNLYYTAGHNPYRFQHTYRTNSNLNSFFSFRGTLPQTFATGGANGGGDPCALVYPAGVWRQATTADFATLTPVNILLPNAGGKALTYHSDATGNYYQYAGATGQASPYPDNQLRFYMNGNGSNLGLLNGVVQVGLGNAGTQVHVWTSSPAVDLLGAATVGGLFYEGVRALTVNNRRQQAQLLNIGLLGGVSNVVQSDFKNVRCVRN